jgi:hypothetical protein
LVEKWASSLQIQEKILSFYLEQRRHYTPFVVSTDGLLGKEAKTLLKHLSALLSENWEKPYSEVCGYGVMLKSALPLFGPHTSVWGDLVFQPQWKDKAGLSLFHH